MPITLMNIDPVTNPAIMPNTPIKTSQLDNAETYSFRNHNAGAGQLSRRKSVMLARAVKPPKTVPRI